MHTAAAGDYSLQAVFRMIADSNTGILPKPAQVIVPIGGFVICGQLYRARHLAIQVTNAGCVVSDACELNHGQSSLSYQHTAPQMQKECRARAPN